MKLFARSGFVLMAVLALGACSLPRGAALQSEVVREAAKEDASFALVEVTRESLPQIEGWGSAGKARAAAWIPASQAPASRVIRAGDRIDLMIWDSQQNSLLTSDAEKAADINGLRVSPTGTIFIPYIDEVRVGGRTPEAARGEIQARLEPIVPSAQVVLGVTAGGDNTVDLVSGVARPARYPLPDRSYTILSLLADGGGISQGLRNPRVRLQREGRSHEIAASALFAEPRNNTVLRGGDRILVEPDTRYFVALGATGTEQLVHFEKEEISALDAISMSGGLNDSRANIKGVLILREYPASAVRGDGRGPDKPQVVFVFDLSSADGLFAARRFRILPEDVVLATESPVKVAATVFSLIGSVAGIGNRLSN